jgi:8-oxo-dGTP diphosphatase
VKSHHDRISLLEHDLRANAFSRLSRKKPVSTFLDHALMSHPQLAVSAVIFRDDKILLVRRARSPAKGFYSLPGGRVEFGESLHAALHREIAEETGLEIEIVGLAAWREVLPGTSDGGHYVILSFAARWKNGEPVLNEELDDYKWLALDALGDLPLTSGLQEVIQSAQRLIEG